MTYKVILAPEAIEDMQSHYDYIAYVKESIINAEAQLSRIREEITHLDTLPDAFRKYPKEPWLSSIIKELNTYLYAG